MRTTIVAIRLFTPEPLKETNLQGSSWLLRSFGRFPDQVILGFFDPNFQKDKSMGRLFSSLEPNTNGQFKLELGVILPDLLPNLDGQQEYCLDVAKEEGDIAVAVSNQMLRLRYKQGEEQIHGLIPRDVLEGVPDRKELKIPDDCHIEFLKTMVTTRFEIAGEDVEDALEKNIDLCIDELITAINRLVSAHLMLPRGRGFVLTPSFDRNTFDYLYILMGGANAPHDLQGHRIALNVAKALLNPSNYTEEEAASFLALVNGTRPIDDISRLLNSGKSYIEAGLLEFALLQIIIAAEIATTRFVDKMLQAAGVSKSKLKDYRTELTFSQKLNVYLFALCPPGMKPDRQLIGSIDRGRNLRNDVMHEGMFNASREELRSLYVNTVKYLEFLDIVLKSRGLN